MADDKKKGGGGELKPLGASTPWEFFFIAGILVLLLSYAAANLSGFLGTNPLTRSVRLEKLYMQASLWWKIAVPYLQILSFLTSAFFIYAIISLAFKVAKIQKKVSEQFAPPAGVADAAALQAATPVANPATHKWERVQKHINSSNPNDWKIAIIEADAILDEMVNSMGYDGETLGEKLKNVEQSDFTTINNAWEAHKVRNMIAHEASFQLDEREARRVISLFESVFEEFHYI